MVVSNNVCDGSCEMFVKQQWKGGTLFCIWYMLGA